MTLKKINATAALAVILSALCHIAVMTYSLWTGWYNYKICKTLPRITMTFLLVHILLSIIIFFFFHDGADVKYKRLNMGTAVQRITAIIMMIFLHFHMMRPMYPIKLFCTIMLESDSNVFSTAVR